MTTLHIQLDESLFQELKKWAAREQISVEELAAAAVSDKVSVLQQMAYLRERAARGDRRKFLEVLAKVPDVPPIPPDTEVPEENRKKRRNQNLF